MSADLNIILPEILLALFAIFALLGGVYTGKDGVASTLVWLTSAAMVALAAWIGLTGEGANVAFNGMFSDDGFSRFAKVVILLSTAAVLIMGEGYMSKRGLLRFEYPILVALSVVGMMMMVSAGDLMALYMGLELQSLALYVVASLRRDSARSTEAGLKYFVLGALSSGILLYGASLIYGYAGTTLFSGIIQTAVHGDVSVGLLFGLIFVISGMAFKVSAVPFHMWTPDVYEGAPTPITAFFATAPKVAAMGLFARVMHDAFGKRCSRLAASHRVNFFAVHVLGRSGCNWANEHQTPDGVFIHCTHGLCFDGAGCGYCTGRRGDACLHDDLCRYEHRHIRLYSFDGKRWPTGHRHIVTEHVCKGTTWSRFCYVDLAVFTGWCSTNVGLLR